MDYRTIHQNLSKRVRDIMPSHIARLSWSREKIDAFQLKQLRLLLQHVSMHSAYYQNMLRSYDIDQITLADLKQLPVLTKTEVLKHWDNIICVPDINKAQAEAHLQSLRDNPKANPFFKDKYYVTATGGSSGLRGLYVWDLDYFSNIAAVDFRHQIRDEMQAPGFIPRTTVVLTAPSAIHASTPLCTTELYIHDKTYHFGADLPIQTICEALNDLKPTHLIGYASVITRLAREALNGKLFIKPKRATTNSEPLNDEGRETIQKAWGIQPNNTWGSVEMGIAGVEDDKHAGLLLSEDMIIFEPVDNQLNPVKNPKDARKLIITNLLNKTLPLIRYVVDDVVEILDAPFSDYRITPNIAGRSDDWFVYKNQVEVHPMIFWDVFEREPLMSEYQVEQTKEGATIRIIAYDGINIPKIQLAIESGLKKSGLTHPKLSFERVKTIARHEETGKLRRFMPLTT
ncbi:MAG: hypothetical protein P1U32_08895 [Legionellaceae bacterium]|nr:hypothetical protein [Legionellaceae bacterium]